MKRKIAGWLLTLSLLICSQEFDEAAEQFARETGWKEPI